MKFKKMVSALCLTMLTLPAFSQSAGTTVFEFLKTQYSARGAALANNLVAVPGDLNAMFTNPAVLAGIEKSQWTANYVDHLLDFQGGQIAFGKRENRFGTLAIGLIYFNYGDFEETNQFGEQTGRNFGASEFALAGGISNVLGEGFTYGVNFKFVYSSLDNYSASGLAFDGGIIYSPSYISDFQFGVSVANLGFVMSHYTENRDEELPTFLRVGFAKKLAHLPLLFTASLNDLTLDTGDNADIFKRFSVGGEFDLSEAVRFRIGYDNGVNQSVKSLGARSFGGLSAGIGVNYKNFRLDYAFSNYGDLGKQNRLGITGGL